MSDLARLTIDLARRLGAERVIALGAREPERLAEIGDRMPLLVLDQEPRLAGLGGHAPGAKPLAWTPGDPLPAAATDAAASALIVCDGLLAALDDPGAALGALDELLESAPGALVSTADRDLVGDTGGDGAQWNAEELLDLLAHARLETVWIGLTDARGSLGRRAGLTCALSRNRPGELRTALAAGPLGLEFDPAARRTPGARRRARVCIASYEFVGPTRTGGIGTAYTSLAEALARDEHQVTVLFTGWTDPAAEAFGHWVRHYRSRGIRLERLPQPTATWIETGHRHAVRAYEAYRWLRERDREDPFDVIHFPEVLGHGYYSICARRLGVAFERTTIAVGAHSSTSWVLEANGTVFQALDDFADDFIERRCVEACDALVSPSAYMRDWMRARGWRLPERNFVQQYARSSAVDDLAAPPTEPAAPSDGRTELVFFGRLEPRKGLRVFCNALDLLAEDVPPPDCSVTFLGKRSSIEGVDAATYVRRRTERWPWEVKLVDDLGQPEAIEYLRSPGRRMTVIPSLADNSPNTVYEALALRIPFIASRVGGTAELIDPRDLGRSTFDPEADLPLSGDRGAISLAARLRETIAAGNLEPPRPTVAAEACRNAHVRWHAAVTAAPVTRSQERPGIAACVVGSEPSRVAASRRSLEAQGRAPEELLVAEQPAAAEPTAEVVLFMPAGSELVPGALEALEGATAIEGVDVIALPVATSGPPARRVTRVPVGGPATAGLLRRCFGDAAFAIRRATLERLGGLNPAAEPADQAHELLCRAALAGIEIEVYPDALVTEVPPEALAEMSIVEASHRRQAILDAFRRAPERVGSELPLLTQQLWATAIVREDQFADLYANRFGRLTLPIRRTLLSARRIREIFRRRQVT